MTVMVTLNTATWVLVHRCRGRRAADGDRRGNHSDTPFEMLSRQSWTSERCVGPSRTQSAPDITWNPCRRCSSASPVTPLDLAPLV
ncbi:hypothetical protein BC826DRAFT_987735 [Russula brevipes]|nr:hypothetical protein BC826DRAFT_987735 [Russula brevipes]